MIIGLMVVMIAAVMCSIGCHFSHVPRQPQCSGIPLCFADYEPQYQPRAGVNVCQTVECETSVCSFVAVDLVAYAKLFSTFDLLMMPEYSVLELSHLFMLLPTSFF